MRAGTSTTRPTTACGGIWNEGAIMNRATKWMLALAILLFALLAGTASYHMLLGPGYGGMPFWGAWWGERMPSGYAGDAWRGDHGWGGRFGGGPMGWGMMGWHGGDGMMGGGDFPGSGAGWQAELTPPQRARIGEIRADALRQEGALQAQVYAARADLLTLDAAVKPDPAAVSRAWERLAGYRQQVDRIRFQARQQVEAVLRAPPQPAAQSSAPGS